MTKAGDSLYRAAALKARDDLSERTQPVLQIAPTWARATYRTLIFCLCATLLFVLFARVGHYADGTAVIRLGDARPISAHGPEVIERVHVRPGQKVAAGDLLVQFHAHEFQGQAEHAREEYTAAVQAWLLDPARAAAVADARSRLGAAQARLMDREVRAAQDGAISDVRVRAGQAVSAGQVLLTQAGAQGRDRVTLFLPGQIRPQLEEGQTVWLELHGHPLSRLELRLARIDSDVTGSEEARSLLGFGLADALSMSGTLVRAEALIEEAYFEAAGHRYRLHDGMTANAQVLLGRQPLLLALAPGVR